MVKPENLLYDIGLRLLIHDIVMDTSAAEEADKTIRLNRRDATAHILKALASRPQLLTRSMWHSRCPMSQFQTEFAVRRGSLFAEFTGPPPSPSSPDLLRRQVHRPTMRAPNPARQPPPPLSTTILPLSPHCGSLSFMGLPAGGLRNLRWHRIKSVFVGCGGEEYQSTMPACEHLLLALPASVFPRRLFFGDSRWVYCVSSCGSVHVCVCSCVYEIVCETVCLCL